LSAEVSSKQVRERSPKAGTIVRIISFLLTCAGLTIAVFAIFGFSLGGKVLFEYTYYFALIACFLPLVFLFVPMREKDKGIPRWYDFLCAALVFGCSLYLLPQAYDLMVGGFLPMSAPRTAVCIVLFLLILEAARRRGGIIFTIIALLFGLYPIFASYMPGLFTGIGSSFDVTMGHMILSATGILGIPSRIIGYLIIGFLVFAGFLIASGAGDFFLNLALALLGKYRGGVAKVSVVASALFGSLSGSAISNVIGTGSITIPAMKKSGYNPYYAAAIEACASTGGVLMPPVMGAIIFVMASVLNIAYTEIMIIAFIPAILYYFGLFLQADAHAAKTGIKGLSQQEIPSLKKTLKEGWPYLAVLVFLVWGLLYMRWERLAPFYATCLLIPLSFFSAKTRLTWRRIIETLEQISRLVSETIALILPIGFILVGMIVTGTAPALTAAISSLGQGNIAFLVLLAVAMCWLFGMMGVGIGGYVILAITMAPAIKQAADLNLLAVHLFLVYYCMLALITPPVAVASFVAASIAGSNPLKTGIQSMRLGVVIYFIPLFFLFNPALILQGSSILTTVRLLAFCLVGIALIAWSLEGYLPNVGKLPLWMRPFLAIAGFLWSFPEWVTTAVGAAVTLILLFIYLINTKPSWSKGRNQS